MRRLPMSLVVFVLACGGGAAQQPVTKLEPPSEPTRTAAEAEDLRVMLAELAAKRVCDEFRGKFRPMKSDVGGQREVTGTLWFEECSATQEGTQVTLELGGRGWRWLFREKEKYAADFEVSEYVKFGFDLQVRGTLDAAYARDAHVFTAWFTPHSAPEVNVRPIGDIQVNEESLWADVLSGAASVVMRSPEARAEQKLESRARQRFIDKFADVFTVAVDLCTGDVDYTFGRVPQGEMITKGNQRQQGPDVEARAHREGLVITGPYSVASRPLTLTVDVQGEGAVRAQLVCADEAGRIADAFLRGQRLPSIHPVAGDDVADQAELRAPIGAPCKEVAVVTQPLPGFDTPIAYTYDTDHPGRGRDALASCPDRSVSQR